jgi:hypothetical protein
VRKCSPGAHNQSYVHAGPSPIEKTAIQADISGKLLGNLRQTPERGKRGSHPLAVSKGNFPYGNIVPFPPGGGTYLLAGVVATKLREALQGRGVRGE